VLAIGVIAFYRARALLNEYEALWRGRIQQMDAILAERS